MALFSLLSPNMAFCCTTKTQAQQLKSIQERLNVSTERRKRRAYPITVASFPAEEGTIISGPKAKLHFSPRELLLPKTPLEREVSPCDIPQPCTTRMLSYALCHLQWAGSRILGAHAKIPGSRSWLLYLSYVQSPLSQVGLLLARGKYASKPKLGSRSQMNKFNLWSVLLPHAVPPAMNPVQARVCEGTHTNQPKQREKERNNAFDDRKWNVCLIHLQPHLHQTLCHTGLVPAPQLHSTVRLAVLEVSFHLLKL